MKTKTQVIIWLILISWMSLMQWQVNHTQASRSETYKDMGGLVSLIRDHQQAIQDCDKKVGGIADSLAGQAKSDREFAKDIAALNEAVGELNGSIRSQAAINKSLMNMILIQKEMLDAGRDAK